MFYRAMKLMLSTHEGQNENKIRPFFLHPMRVMNLAYNKMQRNGFVDQEILCIALLHDFFPCGGNIRELKEQGMTKRVIKGVKDLFINQLDLSDFLTQIKSNEDALFVKILEIQDLKTKTLQESPDDLQTLCFCNEILDEISEKKEQNFKAVF